MDSNAMSGSDLSGRIMIRLGCGGVAIVSLQFLRSWRNTKLSGQLRLALSIKPFVTFVVTYSGSSTKSVRHRASWNSP